MSRIDRRRFIGAAPAFGVMLLTLGNNTLAMDAKTRAEFEEFKKRHMSEFDAYQKKFNEEFNQFKKIHAAASEKFEKDVGKVWDKPELSSPTVWVDYSKDLKTKNSVDFANGVIRISTTVAKGDKAQPDIKSQVRNLMVKNKTEAFNNDRVAQEVEQKSRSMETVERANVTPEPILLPYVVTKPQPTAQDVDKAVDSLVAKKKEKVTTNKKGEKVITVELPLPVAVENDKSELIKSRSQTTTPNPAQEVVKKARTMADLRVHSMPKGARNVSKDVSVFAKRYNLDESLVYAIIETESAFNPMAKSPIPAYGLMQIVPSSAGVDATKMIFGKPKILAPSYLYTGNKNIEIGTAYLHILYSRYLRKIENPVSRLYCSIAAYNTGAGNVAKAFTGNRKLGQAVPLINKKSPDQVYDHLVKNLPYDETRKYLKKVVTRMPKYSPQG